MMRYEVDIKKVMRDFISVTTLFTLTNDMIVMLGDFAPSVKSALNSVFGPPLNIDFLPPSPSEKYDLVYFVYVFYSNSIPIFFKLGSVLVPSLC
jgi:hypothetical protein